MNDFYHNKVIELYDSMVKNNTTQLAYTETSDETHKSTASDVCDRLEMKVLRPLRFDRLEEDESLTRIVYDNITVLMDEQLKSLKVEYYNNMEATIEDACNEDANHIANFIIEANKLTPLWHNIIRSREKLEKMKRNANAKIAQHIMYIKQQKRKATYSLRTDEQLKLDYYNMKASILLLQHNNPFWEKQRTTEGVLKQCLLYHIDPPIEQWFKEFEDIIEECEKEIQLRTEREEIKKREALKWKHQVNLKLIKVNALINTIIFHSGMAIHVGQSALISYGKYGHFDITLSINEQWATPLKVGYDDIDELMPSLLEAFELINCKIPQLQAQLEELKKDGRKYTICTNHYRNGGNCYFVLRVLRNIEGFLRPTDVDYRSAKTAPIRETVDSINEIYHKLYTLTKSDDPWRKSTPRRR